MFEEGNLLRFVPFLFKNGAVPKPKYFVVLKSLNGDMLLASLPTSKDHIPADMTMGRGCLDVPERRLNIFVFLVFSFQYFYLRSGYRYLSFVRL